MEMLPLHPRASGYTRYEEMLTSQLMICRDALMTMVSIDNNNQDNNVIISVKNPVQRAFCAFPRQSLDRTTTTTTVLRPFFRDHPGEPVPEENFWTLWCKGRLTEADTSTIRLCATPSGLISAHLHHPPRTRKGTGMWCNAKRDGRPTEYRWRPLFNAAKCS